MKLSGNYTHEELARTLQGNFSCREFVKDSRGRYLKEEEQHTRLELFFLSVDFYPHTGKIVISKIKDDDKGSTTFIPMLTLYAENNSNE